MSQDQPETNIPPVFMSAKPSPTKADIEAAVRTAAKMKRPEAMAPSSKDKSLLGADGRVQNARLPVR